MADQVAQQGPQVHIRYEGRSIDIQMSELDLGRNSSDNDIRRILANYLEAPVEKLRNFAIDRHETGNITVRPQAQFG
jgi:hypothetical protein